MAPADQATLLLRLEIEQFLAYEAWLLDERRLYDWLDCFTADARYTLAVRETVQGRDEQLAPLEPPSAPLVDDDKEFMTVRVKRLDTRLAHAEQPPSFTRHLVTNLLLQSPAGADTVRVTANFLLVQTRIDVSGHTFSGKRDDTLRRVNGQWRIARREVLLDRAPLASTVSVFF
ncbi:MAG TPA: aromatic-ring-hydroxylating dioxygenase subunit beta [Chloroflexota bacterium]|nr:aromatic-ring-hydroxylating dioxygenase subunit beta [Chloroflexota bacterium]